MAQLVRAPPCHGGGRGFEPHPGRLIEKCVERVSHDFLSEHCYGLSYSGVNIVCQIRDLSSRVHSLMYQLLSQVLWMQAFNDLSQYPIRYAPSYTRDLSSAGRASALQAEGHRFEPYRSHSSIIYWWCVRRCGGIGRRKGLKIPRWQHRAGSSPATCMMETGNIEWISVSCFWIIGIIQFS